MRSRVLGVMAVVVGLVVATAWWLSREEQLGADVERPLPSAGASSPPPPTRPPVRPAEVPVPSTEAELAALPPTLGSLEPGPPPDAGTGELRDGGETPAATRERLKAFLAKNAADAEKYVDRYCEIAKGLKPLKSPGATDRKRDAALYMGVRVDWEDGRVGLLHLPKSLTDRMANPQYAWRTFTPSDYAGLDFSWLKELEQFDSWSLSVDGPLHGDVKVPAIEVPIPNYIVLQHWVKLRLVKGLNEGDLPTAQREVRHLGDLVGSSGTLVSEMIRLAFLGIERGFLEARGIVPDDPPYSANDVTALRHASFGGMYLLFPGVPRAVKEKALKCMPSRCSGINEALSVTSSMRAFVEGADAELDWLQQQSPCDPALARTLANAPAYDEQRLHTLLKEDDWAGGKTGIAGPMNVLLDGGL